MSPTVKKSLYVFLTAMLGALLFLIIHRMLAFGYLLFLYYNYNFFSFGFSFMEILAIDYFTLILALMFGAWYGIWIGLHWYDVVYQESGSHGFVGHFVRHYWPTSVKSYNLKSKIAAVEKKLENNIWELEDLAKKTEINALSQVPAKKRIVRRKTK